jgi:2-oxoglutarate ferredoxin oxidoreductase subunit gamma
MAGHGGQGVLELANYVSYYELLKGKRIAYTPSYGPESRGGKVKCYVVTSEKEIDSPIVEEPDLLIVMNIPSMDFVSLLRKGGTLLMNSSLIMEDPKRKDIRTIKIPATEIADGLKNIAEARDMKDTRIVANSVMFGAYLAITEDKLEKELVNEVYSHFLIDRKSAYIPLNLAAVSQGFEYERNLPQMPQPSERQPLRELEDAASEICECIELSYI